LTFAASRVHIWASRKLNLLNFLTLEKLLLRNEAPTVLVRLGSSGAAATGDTTPPQPLEALSVEAIGA